MSPAQPPLGLSLIWKLPFEKGTVASKSIGCSCRCNTELCSQTSSPRNCNQWHLPASVQSDLERRLQTWKPHSRAALTRLRNAPSQAQPMPPPGPLNPALKASETREPPGARCLSLTRSLDALVPQEKGNRALEAVHAKRQALLWPGCRAAILASSSGLLSVRLLDMAKL